MLRGHRKPPRRSKVERCWIAPEFADHGTKSGASYTFLHRPQRVAGVPCLDMDELFGKEARWVDPTALQDGHPILDPQEGPFGSELREQEARPARIARVNCEQFGKSGAGRRRQVPALVQPAGETMIFSRPGARGDSSAGDQRQASCHTTHNIMFYFCSCRATHGQESIPRLGRA